MPSNELMLLIADVAAEIRSSRPGDKVAIFTTRVFIEISPPGWGEGPFESLSTFRDASLPVLGDDFEPGTIEAQLLAGAEEMLEGLSPNAELHLSVYYNVAPNELGALSVREFIESLDGFLMWTEDGTDEGDTETEATSKEYVTVHLHVLEPAI